MTLLLRAGVAAALVRRDEAARLARRAEDAAEETDMRLYGAAARFRRGQILGGEQGAALMEGARQFVKSQTVRNPDRLIAMLSPGEWP